MKSKSDTTLEGNEDERINYLRRLMVLLLALVILSVGIYFLYFGMNTLIGILLTILGSQIGFTLLPNVVANNATKVKQVQNDHTAEINIESGTTLQGNIFINAKNGRFIKLRSKKVNANVIIYSSIEELKLILNDKKDVQVLR